MEKPKKDTWDNSDFLKWRKANKPVILRTRYLFSYCQRYKSKEDRIFYGVNFDEVIKTLPEYKGKEHIDHIVPLSEFSFKHEDGSINEIEVQKAWSPANLRIVTPSENMHKSSRCNIATYPLRFEYVFDKERQINEAYEFFREAKARDIRVFEEIAINW